MMQDYLFELSLSTMALSGLSSVAVISWCSHKMTKVREIETDLKRAHILLTEASAMIDDISRNVRLSAEELLMPDSVTDTMTVEAAKLTARQVNMLHMLRHRIAAYFTRIRERKMLTRAKLHS